MMSSSSSKVEVPSYHEPEKVKDDRPLNRSRSVKQRLTHISVPKSTLFSCGILFFFVLQVFYIVLAAFCLSKPITLRSLGLSDAEIIGGYTVIFVVWQKVAIMTGQYIADEILNKERPAEEPPAASPPEAPRSEESPPGEGGLVQKEKQKISALIIGFLPPDVVHISRGKASKHFKLAFLASASIFALSSLAPGMINAATMLIDTPTTIQIGRLLSQAQDSDTQEVFTTQARANLILRLEMIEHSPFGFKLPQNVLVPVPKVELTSFNGTIQYDSDIVEFHHDCHWEAPQFFNVSGSGIIVASAGQQWGGATVGAGQIIIGSSVGSLSLTTFPIEERVGINAFIFSGGNSSVLDRRFNPPAPYAVDLTSLPTTFTAEGAGLDLKGNSVYAPLSSVLICDPRPRITGGRISVTNDGNVTIVASGKTPVGNIPESAANLIFANAFQVATAIPETLVTVNAVNNVVATMFMATSTAVNWDTAQGIRPLDLPSINRNMDTFMLSAAKAYIDGYRKNGTTFAVEFDLETVPTRAHKPNLALTTSKPLFIVTTILVAVNTLLLLALCRSGLAQHRHPFDLNHVSQVLGEDTGRGALLLAAQRGKSGEL